MTKLYALVDKTNKNKTKNKKNKNIKQKKLRHKFYPFTLLTISSVFGLVYYVQYKNYCALNNKADKILTDIKKENAREKKLKKQIKSYDNNDYIEKIARDKLGLVKSDEIIFYYDK